MATRSFVIADGKDKDGHPLKNAQGALQKVVEQRTVTLGPSRGDQVSVLKGLKPGEEVVSAGVFRLQGGSPVNVSNSVQPSNDLDPKPINS